ncbi:phenylalanine--tRNA ligase beta subunit-related protein [Psychrobacter proteolyticus]|uniref:phenylalanine--tRNA ligase beta subunit-related protein n=1 Tax=Psychrobacter proteolyticus TaxID=147825 RepID=UPI002234812B|nr:phenylalanine--tRNA ligase beta subunit-related protein [Psychrobacter proteolyticus]
MDISITPNRGDCFSVRGIAREISVINDLPVQMPEISANTAGTAAAPVVTVDAKEACPRYLLQSIRNIDRSIEPQNGCKMRWYNQDYVHITFGRCDQLRVLMELGQPLHAFDADKIEGDIVVRLAQPDETITLLNEQTVTLTGDELVIADDKGALALAGIMGGQRSSVTDSTTNIVVESAFFNQLAIAASCPSFWLAYGRITAF